MHRSRGRRKNAALGRGAPGISAVSTAHVPGEPRILRAVLGSLGPRDSLP